ncbi:hypothetical protein VPHPS15B6_0084 [Vibrio phage PS15B-6]
MLYFFGSPKLYYYPLKAHLVSLKLIIVIITVLNSLFFTYK